MVEGFGSRFACALGCSWDGKGRLRRRRIAGAPSGDLTLAS